MRPVQQTMAATGATAPVVLDYIQAPFAVGLFLDFDKDTSSGTVTVEYSFDDPWAVYATDYGTNATWFADPNLTNKTASADGNIAFPVRAVRANCSIFGDTGTIYFTVIQAVKGS